tara:strand:- start:890 stop:1153 length:264 start_codon:yes stop_codon:yes gene_type:complete
MKVNPNKKLNQDFKSFEIEIKDIDWKTRCELNDMMLKETKNGAPSFSFWGKVVLDCTTLTESELNKYSTTEIIAIANAIFEEANGKK